MAEVKYKGRTLVLLKPSTYMNPLGKGRALLAEAEKIEREEPGWSFGRLALPFGSPGACARKEVPEATTD